MALIRSFEKKDIKAVKELTDQCIGQNYYEINELEELQQQSISKNISASFVLEINNQIKGIRLSFPPNSWKAGKGLGLCEEKWPHKKENTAYFQSLFIHPDFTNQGFGKQMSLKSIEVLKQMGAKGIVCHAWKESPQDSSRKYLSSLKFEVIKERIHYWKNVDYLCPRCGKPCLCTAVEMYLDLEKK